MAERRTMLDVSSEWEILTKDHDNSLNPIIVGKVDLKGGDIVEFDVTALGHGDIVWISKNGAVYPTNGVLVVGDRSGVVRCSLFVGAGSGLNNFYSASPRATVQVGWGWVSVDGKRYEAPNYEKDVIFNQNLSDPNTTTINAIAKPEVTTIHSIRVNRHK